MRSPPNAVAKAKRHIEDAVNKGAKVAVGGKSLTLRKLFFEPTTRTGATSDMLVVQEEKFGPLAPPFCFETVEEVIDIPRRRSSYDPADGHRLSHDPFEEPESWRRFGSLNSSTSSSPKENTSIGPLTPCLRKLTTYIKRSARNIEISMKGVRPATISAITRPVWAAEARPIWPWPKA